MEAVIPKNALARQLAEDKFSKNKQRDLDVMGHQRQLQDAATAKLIRLRTLRLAKEAAEREAEALATVAAEPRPKRARRAKPKNKETESKL
jgi:hypothetical protein